MAPRRGYRTGGSVVGLQTGNRCGLLIAHLACNLANLTFVPLSTNWRKTELESLLRRSGASVLIVPPARKDVDYLKTVLDLRHQLPNLKLIGGTDGVQADFDFDAVSQGMGEVPDYGSDANLPGFITVTSGTTDIPKMSQWTSNNLLYALLDYASAVGMVSGDRALAVAPANTGATGYLFPVLAPVLVGASSVLLEEWSPREALVLLESETATHAAAIPTQLVKMLQDPTLAERNFDAVRVITSAGAPLTPDTAADTEKLFGCAVTTVYGTTDGGIISVTRTSDDVAHRRTSVGRPVPGGEVRLVDPAGIDVAAGAAGEVIWRTPSKSLGYLNDDERTDLMFVGDGWFHSGDLGSFDDDGYLSIVGRSKDLIIRGGQNISPLELEQLIARHPSVSEVSVIGIPDPVYGERTCACVVLRPDSSLDLSDLVAFLTTQEIAPYKLPERLELFDDFPKTAGGKLSKVTVKSAVAERAAASV
jgi:acyl-CoA synthetase (AMP-forming)/AMP-acid ligase II